MRDVYSDANDDANSNSTRPLQLFLDNLQVRMNREKGE